MLVVQIVEFTAHDDRTCAAARWVDWATDNASIYFGVVPRAQIEECVDMQSGLIVEDCGANRSEQDTEPVPPWRRHAWHKKLLKEVRRTRDLYSPWRKSYQEGRSARRRIENAMLSGLNTGFDWGINGVVREVRRREIGREPAASRLWHQQRVEARYNAVRRPADLRRTSGLCGQRDVFR